MLSPISNPLLTNQTIDPAQLQEIAIKEAQLKKVAMEFEAILTKSFLKEGLKSTLDENNENSQATNTYNEIAYEQIAYEVGKKGLLGIAKSLTQSLNEQILRKP